MNDTTETRPPSLQEIRRARERIASTVIRTPLVRIDLGPDAPETWLKLENLQPINAFKIRGAANAVAALSHEARARGVWTISAGNAGQGVAYAARAAGIPSTVVAIETAPQTKLDRMERLGATLVRAPFDACWQAMEDRHFEGVEGTFIHPFDDDDFVAGNATIGLEIVEDLPSVRTVVTGIGGGGLIAGVGAAVKALDPTIEVVGSEPETAAPGAMSMREGRPMVFDQWQASFVDGAGGKSIFPRMWSRIAPVVDRGVVVSLEQVKGAMRVMAETARVISEGAGALGLAAVLDGQIKRGPVVCVVSGGNIDLASFAALIGAVPTVRD